MTKLLKIYYFLFFLGFVLLHMYEYCGSLVTRCTPKEEVPGIISGGFHSENPLPVGTKTYCISNCLLGQSTEPNFVSITAVVIHTVPT